MSQRMPGSGFCYWLAAASWVDQGGENSSVCSDGAEVQKPYLQVRAKEKEKNYFSSKENASQFLLRQFYDIEIIL